MIRTHVVQTDEKCFFCGKDAVAISQDEEHDGELLRNDGFVWHCEEHKGKARGLLRKQSEGCSSTIAE
jgi:hypothetical protein